MEEQFINICLSGNLEEAKNFLTNNPNALVGYQAVNDAFEIVYERGYLEFSEWIYEKNPEVDISAYDELLFREACYSGNLEIAKWLLKVKPDINISTWDEDAFRQACYYGHLELAKWLLQVKPSIDISADKDWAFESACKTNKLEVAEWLQSLKPEKYHLEVVDNKIISYKIKINDNTLMRKQVIMAV